ncbi:potential peroxisomal protein Pmp4 [Pseudozyma hubeiensis SY62]|uniref:Potential peroxisomal protein Pmp4 n=1 Tax=Pseudozyma hubeiensis (strain SY62) TaxID=1305764 RepID=R9P914_PSEHS|nr:potential peroxisomal protein Pmp4 [Pseudozyma hubeiensis SY62]GAC97841.1 potential peroxisomal protein Pmp4 [Pseudozyma hubeiensis SY62]
MSDLQKSLTQVALNPAYHDLFTILKGFRNGVVYGAKIRFPHALVMTFLFGRGTPREKLTFILRATKQHALNLGTFTPLYKFLTIAMRRLFEATGGKGPVPKWHSLVAGLIGGYYVFGERTPVNEQIVLYTSSRIIASFLPRAETPKDYPVGKPKPTDKSWFAAYATITWGVVMYLHQYRRETIQSGMVNSMDSHSAKNVPDMKRTLDRHCWLSAVRRSPPARRFLRMRPQLDDTARVDSNVAQQIRFEWDNVMLQRRLGVPEPMVQGSSQVDDADMNVDRQGMRRVRAVRRRSMAVTTLRRCHKTPSLTICRQRTIDELQTMLRRHKAAHFDAAR